MKDKNKNPKNNKYTFYAIMVLALLLSFIYAGYLDAPAGIESDLLEPDTKEQLSSGEEKNLDHKSEEFDIEDYLLDEIDKEILETLKLEQIRQYRKFIINTSRLVRKFLEDQNFDQELTYLKTKNDFYGKEVADVINLLELYNTKYLIAKVTRYEDFEVGSSFLRRILSTIFDISKKNPLYYEMEKEKTEIRSKLMILEKHFHSVDFLKVVLSYD